MFFIYLLSFNLFLILIMGIFEIKHFKKFLIWASIVFIFSIFGFLFYIIFGNRLKFKSKKQIVKKQKSTKNYLKVANILNANKNNIRYNKISEFIKNNQQSELWENNDVKIYTCGQDFLNELLVCINKATINIHLEFYIFADDDCGQKIAHALIEKAKQGVKVKVIYDAFGSRHTSKNFWNELRSNNIDVFPFFPPIYKLSLLNFKINYRNHRKIAIIDGKVAFTGGINLRDDHMNKNKKLSPWRDTQLKIYGKSVYALQDIFLNDWSFCSNTNLKKEFIKQCFFDFLSHKNIQNSNALQIISSGPEQDKQNILEAFKCIIKTSREYVFIQSPYFVIDSSLKNELLSAHKRGVKISIIIPQKPDKKLVYGATLINLSELFTRGISIYLYKGFIHSKILLTESAISIGSCNFDNRSFYLNFENTCICYDKDFINKNINIIKNDIRNSTLLTKKQFFKLKSHNFFAICFYKLISKIL